MYVVASSSAAAIVDAIWLDPAGPVLGRGTGSVRTEPGKRATVIWSDRRELER